jgi:hypothetical protein
LIAALRHGSVSAEDPYQAAQIIAIPIAANESFGAPEISAQCQPAIKTNILHSNFGLESRRSAGAERMPSTPLHDLYPPVAKPLQPSEDGTLRKAVPQAWFAGPRNRLST